VLKLGPARRLSRQGLGKEGTTASTSINHELVSTQRPVMVNQAEVDWESWDDPEVAARSRVRWKLLIAGERGASCGLVTGVLEVPPGASVLLHHHEPEETYYVMSGHGRVEIDGRESALKPGSAVYIPPNARHAVRCTGAEPLVVVFCFARDRFDQVVLPLRCVSPSGERTLAGLKGARPQGRQEVRAVESPGAAGPDRDGTPRHVSVRALQRTRDQARDALRVRRAAGRKIARARREVLAT